MGYVALIAGVTGVTGRNLALHLQSCDRWDAVYGVSRRPCGLGGKVKNLPMDLSNKASLVDTLKGAQDVTHLFFCAYVPTGDAARDVEANFGMFRDLVEAAEGAGLKLQHVSFLSGTKWYGNHLGPIKTPSREDDPRAMAPNFYYDMEDYCIARVQAGADWTWSSVRPNPVCGFSTGSAMNLTMTIAVYASICKEIGLPFRFPGSPQAYNALLEVVDADLLACSMEYISTQAHAGNTSYNVSNGDVFRWSEVWPKLAAFFELPLAEPQKFSMTTLMSYHECVWNKLVEKHGLSKEVASYKAVATWGFGDWVFGQERDWFSNVSKLRRTGFQGQKLDSADMFLRQFKELRAAKLIP